MATTKHQHIEMLDDQAVSAQLGRWVPQGATVAQTWEANGWIVGIDQRRRHLYPACQFDSHGLPVAVMPEILTALGRRKTPRAIVSWLADPCKTLGGECPYQMMRSDPGAVLEAARLDGAGRAGRPTEERLIDS